MAYKRFDANPDEEFDHYLAEKLHMSVATMREEVSADEWLRWSIYYGRKAQKQELAAEKAKAKHGK